MNYIGSKLQLASWIFDEVGGVVGVDLKDQVFCDMFAGTGVIGRKFKGHVKKVIANDLEYYSFVLNRNYIQNVTKIPKQKLYIEKLNNLNTIDTGFIYTNYCKGSGSGRQYFSDKNGQKIDVIRKKIQNWKKEGKIGDDTYYFLVASLIQSADKVANTASVYGSFLKNIKKIAQKELILEPADFALDSATHEVFNEDSNILIKKIQGDILYLDPPYNQRQYGANYHMLNTIARYDNFTPRGKTGIRAYNASDYSKKSKIYASFEELIKNADFRYIFLSYSSEGLMNIDDIKTIMQKYGSYSVIKKEHKRFKTKMNDAKNITYEYLHVIKK